MYWVNVKLLWAFDIYTYLYISNLDSVSHICSIRYQFELKEEFIKRTEKLTENESRNKGAY